MKRLRALLLILGVLSAAQALGQTVLWCPDVVTIGAPQSACPGAKTDQWQYMQSWTVVLTPDRGWQRVADVTTVPAYPFATTPTPTPTPVPSTPPAPAWTGPLTFSWEAASTNTDGSPITPPVQYRFSLDGVAQPLTAALAFTAPSLAAGQHCGTVAAVTTYGQSAESNLLCKTIAPPVVPAGPVVIAPVAGVSWAPVFGIATNSTRGSTVIGFAPVGAACSGAVVYSYRGQGYRKIDPALVTWWGTAPTASAAAPCSP